MSTRKIIFVLALFLSAAAADVSARKMIEPSYHDRLVKSELVVIATPVTKTADTAEKSTLPGIFYQDLHNQRMPIASIGVETRFYVAAVLKGDPTIRELTLHHYRQAQADSVSTDAPELVAFDPSSRDKRSSFLMFLNREPDGRYAPAEGQTDPGFISISPLPVDSDPSLTQTLNALTGR